MSAVAAARQQTIPLLPEGAYFWKELVAHFQHQVTAINNAAAANGLVSESLRLSEGSELAIVKDEWPSTEIRLKLNVQPWGPTVRGIVTGQQTSGERFSRQEFDVPIARDLDGSIIAIFDEGRSFSAYDLSRYVLQSFRRCFPNFALPC